MSTTNDLISIAKNEQTVYDAGKKAEYDAFWNAFQANGERTNYRQGFSGEGWTDTTFTPKYNIIVEGNAQNMFWGSVIVDMVTALKNNNVTIDTSGATDLSYAFSCNSLYLPEVSAVSATNIGNLFGYNRNLISIKKLILKNDGSQTFSNVFYNCTALVKIDIDGVIGNDIDFKSCPLDNASFESVVSALSSTVTGKTVSFNKKAKEAAFTADEWATLTATKPNWTFNLV